MDSSPPDSTGRLERALELLRTHGIWILAGVAGLASLNVIALVWGPKAAERATRITPGDLLLAGLAVAAGLEVLLYKRRWKHALPPPAMFALVAAALISAGAMVVREWGELLGAMGGAVREIAQLVEVFVVGYAWILWAARKRRDLHRALIALAVAVSANVFLAVVQLGAGAHPFYVRGLFTNRNFLGVFLAVTLPVLVAAASAEGDRSPAARLWMFSTVAAGLAIMTSGGLFAAAVVGVLVAAFAVSSRAGWAAVAAVVTVALAIQPTRALPGVREAQYRSIELFHERSPGKQMPSERMKRWAAGLECLRENPTLGVGPGRFQDQIQRYYLHGLGPGGASSAKVENFDVSFDEPGSHGLYEVIACEGGLLGLAVLAWFLAAALARSGRAAAGDTSGLAAGALGAVVAILIAGAFASVLVRGVALPLVVVLALGWRARDIGWAGRESADPA